MGTASFTLDPANPPTLSPELEARQAAMTPAKIEAGTEGDPENPLLTEAELARMAAAQLARAARAAAGMTQSQFALSFQIAPGRLRDMEQGRHSPDSALVAYLAVIRRDHAAVLTALSEVDQSLTPRGRAEAHARSYGNAVRGWAATAHEGGGSAAPRVAASKARAHHGLSKRALAEAVGEEKGRAATIEGKR